VLVMETTGPAIAREAVGPLRTLFFGPSPTLPPGRGLIFRYGVPLGLLGLIGLAVANDRYLQDNREIEALWSGILSFGAVLPVAIAARRPLVAWRIAYPLLFFGSMNAAPKESWPWAPVQIVGFLVVMLLVAITSDSAVTAWAVGFSVVPGFFFFGQPANAFGMAVLLVAVALIGDVVSRRRRSRDQLAEQTELTELERARRAILEERARIAREMHDVVAHHMSMIAVQAETAPFRVAGLSEPAKAELAGIATSARSALTDMRRLLGVLRAESEDAPREPQPGLAELPELVETARRAGVPITFWTAGPDGVPDLYSADTPAFAEVPGAVGLAAYRIAQEALANAARHAPGGGVRVLVRALDDRLDLTVHNGPAAGPAPDAPAPIGRGHGLVGMRERAALLGGELTTGPDDRGGFRVAAVLPYPRAAE
jgi:signal transduction histidine kinase